MTGALGISFGSTRSAIIASKGAPQFDRVGFEGVHSLGYPVTVMGQEAVAIFMVERGRGMTRALIAAPVEDAGRCALVLALWQRGLEQKYGDGRSDGSSPTVGCNRFASRNTMWGEIWHEPTGRRILLSLMPGQPSVMLLYTTPEADAWERRQNGSQL
jgi:hypothetical protein